MPDSKRRRRWVHIAIVVFVVLGVSGVILTGGSGDDLLRPWHRWAPPSELRAPVEKDFDFAAYLDLEGEVFDELREFVVTEVPDDPGLETSRYKPSGRNNPETFPRNWNRSYEERAARPIGSALLIHGLTDSPYSLRSISQQLVEHGVSVLGLRLPGHGTVPEALDRADRHDWRAAVRAAARHAVGLRRPGTPFFIVGYSNGAALGVEYALDVLEDSGLEAPDRLILVSPAVGITRFAMFAGLPRALRFLPLSEGFRWTDIVPEIDPYKYSSFPANAGYQTHRLTVSNRKRINKLADQGRAGDLPPILAFVSLADSTVKMESVAADLMQPLANPASEMVVFDVNRDSAIVSLLAFDPADRLTWLAEQAPLEWTFTAVTNKGPDTREVVESTWRAGVEDAELRDLAMSWPKGLYSLSHVALQFPPDDPIYGSVWNPDQSWGLPLGSLEPRGEKGLLQLDVNSVMRLRHNPFYPYLEQKVLEFMELKSVSGGSDP